MNWDLPDTGLMAHPAIKPAKDIDDICKNSRLVMEFLCIFKVLYFKTGSLFQ